MKLYFNWREEQKETDRVDRCRVLKALVDRFLLDTEANEKVKVRFMTVIYRLGLSRAEQNVKDTGQLQHTKT